MNKSLAVTPNFEKTFDQRKCIIKVFTYAYKDDTKMKITIMQQMTIKQAINRTLTPTYLTTQSSIHDAAL